MASIAAHLGVLLRNRQLAGPTPPPTASRSKGPRLPPRRRRRRRRAAAARPLLRTDASVFLDDDYLIRAWPARSCGSCCATTPERGAPSSPNPRGSRLSSEIRLPDISDNLGRGWHCWRAPPGRADACLRLEKAGRGRACACACRAVAARQRAALRPTRRAAACSAGAGHYCPELEHRRRRPARACRAHAAQHRGALGCIERGQEPAQQAHHRCGGMPETMRCSISRICASS